MLRRLPILGALALLFAAPGGQQAPPVQSPQVFRSNVNLVPVDVRVLGRDGNAVTGLKESDFTVLENNERQQVRHFSATALTADSGESTGQPLFRSGAEPALGTQSRRVFLIVLGRGRLQPPGKGVDAAIELIKTKLLPQDYVGVLAWNRATDLTNDHAKILNVVERFRKHHELIEALMQQQFSGLAAIYGGSRIPDGIQREIDAVFLGPEAANMRTLPAEPAADADKIARDTRRATDILQRAETVAGREPGRSLTAADETPEAFGLDMSLDEYVALNSQSMQDLTNLYTGIAYLRHVPGEKHIVFVSQNGVFLPSADNDRSLAAIATDARVAVSVLHTGGTSTAFDWRTSTSRTVAELTGGQFTSTQMGRVFMDRVDRGSRFQYVLGYYSTNGTYDGRYRQITVRVNRPGVQVLYRHGYFARQYSLPSTRERIVAYARVTSAASYGADVRDIALSASAVGGKAADGSRQITVQTKIAPERLAFVEAAGRKKGAIDVAVFCADSSERLIGQRWDTINLEMTPDAFQRFLKSGLTYNTTVKVSREARHVKVVVYDAGADLVGSVIVKVK